MSLLPCNTKVFMACGVCIKKELSSQLNVYSFFFNIQIVESNATQALNSDYNTFICIQKLGGNVINWSVFISKNAVLV